MTARAAHLELRDFRNYERAEIELGPGLTVVTGPNGAGKTNLLEGLYFGLTARSCRTSTERELVRTGATAVRSVVGTTGADGREHRLEVGFEPGEPKRLRVDGAPVEGIPDSDVRPLVSVFMPDRLTLVKGPPSARRAHLDRLVAALWPARAEARAAYARALAQRNAAIARVRSGAAPASALDPWDAELARHGLDLMRARAESAARLAAPFAARAVDLGLPEPATLAYMPRSRAEEPPTLLAELRERRESDLERGFTGHGPHRDELVLTHDGRSLRGYGSQGQQRVALLALLFAEREVLLERGSAPLMLLDDVTSELDGDRRERLAEVVRVGGQAVVSATEAGHVPGAASPDVTHVHVEAGRAAVRPRLAAA
ncbi:MAG TPA: DNA replication and repair protein RecF [Thermoleophilaceae bacterium]|nr:DNA replication and repair protein RecF [Thermoleophilaceae bacterium]